MLKYLLENRLNKYEMMNLIENGKNINNECSNTHLNRSVIYYLFKSMEINDNDLLLMLKYLIKYSDFTVELKYKLYDIEIISGKTPMHHLIEHNKISTFKYIALNYLTNTDGVSICCQNYVVCDTL